MQTKEKASYSLDTHHLVMRRQYMHANDHFMANSPEQSLLLVIPCSVSLIVQDGGDFANDDFDCPDFGDDGIDDSAIQLLIRMKHDALREAQCHFYIPVTISENDAVDDKCIHTDCVMLFLSALSVESI